ncbi:MAG: dTDP-4-dehydrorhamnose reductase [Thermodesulfobacteriota bacterium]
MKIALTGSEGMLGYAVKQIFTGVDLIGLSRKDLDITDLDTSVRILREIHPDYLIHAAAYTDVDGCETHTEKAYHVNGIGTRNLVMACEEAGCPILFISSDYVFDGSKGAPYNEWDATNPINSYGSSKLLGEFFVSSLTNKFYIVRTSWLYGENGKNFVSSILNLLTERNKLDIVHDQIGSPTYTVDLAKKLKELMGRGYGIYHITNTSYCSWYEFALEIVKLKKLKATIKPVTSDNFKRPAKRPAFSVLNNTLLRLEGIKESRDWKDALADYLLQDE